MIMMEGSLLEIVATSLILFAGLMLWLSPVISQLIQYSFAYIDDGDMNFRNKVHDWYFSQTGMTQIPKGWNDRGKLITVDEYYMHMLIISLLLLCLRPRA